MFLILRSTGFLSLTYESSIWYIVGLAVGVTCSHGHIRDNKRKFMPESNDIHVTIMGPPEGVSLVTDDVQLFKREMKDNNKIGRKTLIASPFSRRRQDFVHKLFASVA